MTDTDNRQWRILATVLTGSFMTFGLALVPAGRVGDRWGYKRLFLAGLSLFTVASVACGISGNSAELVAARLVQGLGAGIYYPALVHNAQAATLVNLCFIVAALLCAFGLPKASMRAGTPVTSPGTPRGPRRPRRLDSGKGEKSPAVPAASLTGPDNEPEEPHDQDDRGDPPQGAQGEAESAEQDRQE